MVGGWGGECSSGLSPMVSSDSGHPWVSRLSLGMREGEGSLTPSSQSHWLSSPRFPMSKAWGC